MRILVTGSAGFIGQHLTNELEGAGHEVVPYDRHYGSAQDILNYPAPFAVCVERGDLDVVVHLAAKVGRLFGEDDVQRTVTDNAGMTAIVAQACGAAGVRLVYASTSEVYGDQHNRMCVEDGPLNLPHNIYGLSERWGEEVCKLYAPDELTVWRISMPYGPGHPPGRGRAAMTNMLWQAMNREPIPVHEGAERSWCWIGDTVRAMRLTIEETDGGVWNIGRDDNATPMLAIATMACDMTGANSADLVELIPAPARQTVVKRLSTEKIRSLGWRPEVELEEGMARTLTWINNHVASQALTAGREEG